METDLTRIAEKAQKDKGLVFTSLYHHVYMEGNLRASFKSLNGRKATGVDGVTKYAYGEDLNANLNSLSGRLRRGAYHPKPKRRAYVPKEGSEKGRPLGISTLEDKVVEQAVKNVLEPIYEADFEESSYGYRPKRSAHDCLNALGRTIQQKRISYVVEADIRSFFDNVNHEWLMKFLRHRVGDERILRVINGMLHSGIMEGRFFHETDQGTPQGSILSPLLANIYLHYVLDLWFEKRFKVQSRGEAYYFRYADDFVACFQYRSDADSFMKMLSSRLEDFSLQVAEEKTNCIPFGRFSRREARKAGVKPKEFTFLGFTHFSGKTRYGDFKVKRKTARKKLTKGLRSFTEWIKRARHRYKGRELIRRAIARVRGHLNYYAITDNIEKCLTYEYHASRILLKWLNRRSQRNSYTFQGFAELKRKSKWPRVQIMQNLCPFFKGTPPKTIHPRSRM